MYKKMQSAFTRLLALLISLVILAGGTAAGQIENVIHRFEGGSDGWEPLGGLISDEAGNFYGTTSKGGSYGNGSVFQLTKGMGTPGHWKRVTLYSFTGEKDGKWPAGNLIFDRAGNLYGITQIGGSGESGTIFELKPQGGVWTETVLYNFQNNAAVIGGLVLDETGNLYGVTFYSGKYGLGSVFELTPTQGSWTFTTIFSFGGRDEGSYPGSSLIVTEAGNLFGVVAGSPTTGGAVFELKAPHSQDGTWTEDILYEFKAGKDGSGPGGPLIFDQKGNLYGTTYNGGAFGGGTVFQLTRQNDTWAKTAIYSFCAESGCSDGMNPLGGLIFDRGGRLYGTTQGGGSGVGCDRENLECGTLFQLNPPVHGGVWTESVLHNFTGNGRDGYSPYPGGVIHGKFGSLWGTTYYGGSRKGLCAQNSGCGVVFNVWPKAPKNKSNGRNSLTSVDR